MKSLIVGSLLAALSTSQSCTVEDAKKADCGYMGINQQQC